jgi:hypothetical protein
MSSRKVKGSAAVFRRFISSPVTSRNVGGRSPQHRGPSMFGLKPKPPLVLAISMVSDAMEVAFAHLRNAEKMNAEAEFEQLDMLAALLSVNAEITKYIFRVMRKRAKNG